MDECTGPKAESCHLSGGTCRGDRPPGSFTCKCGAGYELAVNSTFDCIGNLTTACHRIILAVITHTAPVVHIALVSVA